MHQCREGHGCRLAWQLGLQVGADCRGAGGVPSWGLHFFAEPRGSHVHLPFSHTPYSASPNQWPLQAETQRGPVICLRPHSQAGSELGSEPWGLAWAPAPSHTTCPSLRMVLLEGARIHPGLMPGNWRTHEDQDWGLPFWLVGSPKSLCAAPLPRRGDSIGVPPGNTSIRLFLPSCLTGGAPGRSLGTWFPASMARLPSPAVAGVQW